MAISITKVDVWAAEIDDQPGALDRILEALAGAGGSVECIIARRRHDRAGKTQVFISPVKGARVQKAARSVGLAPANDLATLRLEGPNKTGQGHMVMRAIADAGINVRGVSGCSIGNKAVAYIGFDNKADADKAAKAVKKLG